MQAMPGSRGAGRRGLQIVDDWGGTKFQGETEGAGAMPGVQEGIVEGVPGGAPPNSERRGEMGVGAGGKRGRWGKRA